MNRPGYDYTTTMQDILINGTPAMIEPPVVEKGKAPAEEWRLVHVVPMGLQIICIWEMETE